MEMEMGAMLPWSFLFRRLQRQRNCGRSKIFWLALRERSPFACSFAVPMAAWFEWTLICKSISHPNCAKSSRRGCSAKRCRASRILRKPRRRSGQGKRFAVAAEEKTFRYAVGIGRRFLDQIERPIGSEKAASKNDLLRARHRRKECRGRG